MPRQKQPMHVAIVGGGCASLTAAFELTRPEHCGRYQVTVYQMGWRLGGKGASGRGVANRIEEHGLHLWLGFYENAFRIMRECYAELKSAPGNRRITDWREAFTPAPDVAVTDRLPNAARAWDIWRAHFPPGQGLPGDSLDDRSPFTVLSYLRQSAILVGELLRSAEQLETDRSAQDLANVAVRYGKFATVAALFEASDTLCRMVRRCVRVQRAF